MKSVNILVVLVIAISIACSSKSVGSQFVSNSGATLSQPSAQPVSTALSQDKLRCALQLAGLSAINDLRLGMTPDEVLAVFPGSKDDPQLKTALANPPGRFGTSEFLIQPSKYGSKEKFTGMSRITLSLLDGRVSAFTINHDGPEYSNVDEFVTKVAKAASLPPASDWELYGGTDNLKILKCAEFEIRVFAGGPGGNLNYVLLKDLVAEQTLKDRRKKAREQASPTP